VLNRLGRKFNELVLAEFEVTALQLSGGTEDECKETNLHDEI
jgi:hypothetical protein